MVGYLKQGVGKNSFTVGSILMAFFILCKIPASV
jgi:hypothetical protein